MRTIFLLTLAQAFAACGMIVLFAFGGIVGTRLAPSPALGTLPLALAVVGVAVTTLPGALLAQRVGRKRALLAGAGIGVCSGLVSAWAVARGDFIVLCAGGALVGAHAAFVMQYRFAATEYVPPEAAGRAISTVMLGTLAAAVLGPAIGDVARLAFGWREFAGSFAAVGVLSVLAMLVLAAMPQPRGQIATTGGAARPLREIAAQRTFKLAVLAGATSFAAMSFIMTATPISMHVLDGMSVAQTRHVITAHLLGMYVPSLASGWLTRAIGLDAMMLLGVAAMAGCVAIATLVDRHFAHYLWGLALLGVGWNLLFVAGSTLLTQTYQPAERFRAQGVNDFVTFGVQAIVSLLAGTVVIAWGWAWLNALSVPLLLAVAIAVLTTPERRKRSAVTP
jgi:predicted MFS family arabinose efflux permease